MIGDLLNVQIHMDIRVQASLFYNPPHFGYYFKPEDY